MALLLTATPGSAVLKDQWLELKAPHFVLYTNRKEAQAQRYLRHFQFFHDTLSNLAQIPTPSADSQLEIYLFRKRSDYIKVTRERDRNGYFLSSWRDQQIVGGTYASIYGAYQVAMHEYTHYLMRNRPHTQLAPLWLEEGLAEFYSTLHFKEPNLAVLGWPPLRMTPFYDNRQQKFRLSQLLASDTVWPGRFGTDFYAQAWGLTHYALIELQMTAEDLTHAARNWNEEDEAFLDLELSELNRRLTNWVQQPRYPMREVTVDVSQTFESPVTRTLDPEEIALLLGNLALRNNPQFAGRAFKRAIKLGGRTSRVLQGQARTAQRNGQAKEAVKLAAEALKLDEGDYMAHAVLADQLELGCLEGDEPEICTAWIERNLTLRESAHGLQPNLETTANLGRAYVQFRQPNEGLPLLNTALEQAPWSAELYFQIALGHHLLGESENAETFLTRASRLAAEQPNLQRRIDEFRIDSKN